jgi:hypothetical protein
MSRIDVENNQVVLWGAIIGQGVMLRLHEVFSPVGPAECEFSKPTLRHRDGLLKHAVWRDDVQLDPLRPTAEIWPIVPHELTKRKLAAIYLLLDQDRIKEEVLDCPVSQGEQARIAVPRIKCAIHTSPSLTSFISSAHHSRQDTQSQVCTSCGSQGWSWSAQSLPHSRHFIEAAFLDSSTDLRGTSYIAHS